MGDVDLGYLEPCESWQVESRTFPSKTGGKPAWLHLEKIPSGSDVICETCNQPLIFLCQLYAPYEEDENNFHRTLFVFVCRNESCCIRNQSNNIRIFRNSLKRENKFYPPDPPSESPDPDFFLSTWLSLCAICGFAGDKKCSKCKLVTYCSRDHQIIDWKEHHKNTCGTNDPKSGYSKILFPEFEIVIEKETLVEKYVDEETEKQKFAKLEEQGELGTLSDLREEELDQHSNKDTDKAFTKFCNRIRDNPEQVLRYSRGDQPLFISNDVKPVNIPNCEYCGSVRQFEFQIMPQMLTLLNENSIDWGVLLFYTCKMSCTDGVNYKKEYVFKQDVSTTNI